MLRVTWACAQASRQAFERRAASATRIARSATSMSTQVSSGRLQLDRVAAGQRLGAEGAAQARELGAQGGGGVGGLLLGPDRVDHLVAAYRPAALDDQEGEQDPSLPAAQRRGHVAAFDIDFEPPAELDSSLPVTSVSDTSWKR